MSLATRPTRRLRVGGVTRRTTMSTSFAAEAVAAVAQVRNSTIPYAGEHTAAFDLMHSRMRPGRVKRGAEYSEVEP